MVSGSDMSGVRFWILGRSPARNSVDRRGQLPTEIKTVSREGIEPLRRGLTGHPCELFQFGLFGHAHSFTRQATYQLIQGAGNHRCTATAVSAGLVLKQNFACGALACTMLTSFSNRKVFWAINRTPAPTMMQSNECFASRSRSTVSAVSPKSMRQSSAL